MRASSQSSAQAARSSFDPVLRQAGAGAHELGAELFEVADLLSANGSLRRSLTDPARDGSDKAELVDRLLSGRVRPDVLDLLSGMCRSRWSGDDDLRAAVELLGTDAVLASAEADGVLLEVESQLFTVQRLLADNRQLRLALADKDRSVAARVRLLTSLIGERVTAQTLQLTERALRSSHEPSLAAALTHLIEAAAERRQQLVATVTAARPLSQAQTDRLDAILERAYGRAVHINVAVDPSVVGGVRIQIGDEVVDATMLTRLDEARRRLAG
ncbi:F0F1 ATP synthase subunit delta [Ruania albidiflava]|uniref:F0F1 ATP synthase subunit delta n=1 Tax=Ruania albidiflava TaxID=366586 RepID=UPI0004294085|nr:F0F1 ATP synthase subunit delta [Ruania albidiflava]